jgi:hypothetical protein
MTALGVIITDTIGATEPAENVAGGEMSRSPNPMNRVGDIDEYVVVAGVGSDTTVGAGASVKNVVSPTVGKNDLTRVGATTPAVQNVGGAKIVWTIDTNGAIADAVNRPTGVIMNMPWSTTGVTELTVKTPTGATMATVGAGVAIAAVQSAGVVAKRFPVPADAVAVKTPTVVMIC